jgi:hypothetical protein
VPNASPAFLSYGPSIAAEQIGPGPRGTHDRRLAQGRPGDCRCRLMGRSSTHAKCLSLRAPCRAPSSRRVRRLQQNIRAWLRKWVCEGLNPVLQNLRVAEFSPKPLTSVPARDEADSKPDVARASWSMQPVSLSTAGAGSPRMTRRETRCRGRLMRHSIEAKRKGRDPAVLARPHRTQNACWSDST